MGCGEGDRGGASDEYVYVDAPGHGGADGCVEEEVGVGQGVGAGGEEVGVWGCGEGGDEGVEGGGGVCG